MNKVIYLIGGKAGSGKDTMADYMCKNYGCKRLAYADALKDYTSEKYNIDRNLFDTQDGKMKVIKVNDSELTIRQLLINVSLEKKLTNENLWIDIVIQQILDSDKEFIVISDFRYPAEYFELTKKFNYVSTIKIVRDNVKLINDHSETALDTFDFDCIIDNNSDVNSLYSTLDSYMI